tara:strand:- start:233 stop:775 length:543 start_codon:yes stop_codon:yes gene_type:complete
MVSITDFDMCAICHEHLIDNIYELPECSHKFHTNCIMHWFRTDHNTCPLCQNCGINFNIAYQQANSHGYAEKRLWESYYPEACRYAKKKNADKEIISKIRSLKKTIENDKNKKKNFKIWRKTICDGISSNKKIYDKYINFQRNKWRIRRNVWKRKVAIGYLYFHKHKRNKIIIAEKIQLS